MCHHVMCFLWYIAGSLSCFRLYWSFSSCSTGSPHGPVTRSSSSRLVLLSNMLCIFFCLARHTLLQAITLALVLPFSTTTTFSWPFLVCIYLPFDCRDGQGTMNAAVRFIELLLFSSLLSSLLMSHLTFSHVLPFTSSLMEHIHTVYPNSFALAYPTSPRRSFDTFNRLERETLTVH